MMRSAAKLLQLAGIIITGTGLIYGIAENDMSKEFMFLGAGIVVFLIGVLLDRRG